MRASGTRTVSFDTPRAIMISNGGIVRHAKDCSAHAPPPSTPIATRASDLFAFVLRFLHGGESLPLAWWGSSWTPCQDCDAGGSVKAHCLRGRSVTRKLGRSCSPRAQGQSPRANTASFKVVKRLPRKCPTVVELLFLEPRSAPNSARRWPDFGLFGQHLA